MDSYIVRSANALFIPLVPGRCVSGQRKHDSHPYISSFSGKAVDFTTSCGIQAKREIAAVEPLALHQVCIRLSARKS